MVPVERIELPISRSQGERIATVLHRQNLASRDGDDPPSSVLETDVLPA